ncbi:MAG: hypothetical protein A2687_01555 [Candidatus Levybacteria bacterium RIFCSPHIGHO2_01_FULL_38_26]|nr:MAG: hypothetical protein A2687_01555 [Candidatus Levybacteria bacterium RIFCSPHIGHO2_01_FULL_38_26]
MNNKHFHIIEQVPVDYYQNGIERNIFQRFWHVNKLKTVVRLIKDSQKTILDVGCAGGWFISEISNKFPKTKCHGIDIYDKGIKYAKKIYPKIEFKTADAHKIPYRENSFDLVICTEVLEHLDDPRGALLEIKRVLRKYGRAVIELDSGGFIFSVAWYAWRKFDGRVWNGSHLHSFNIKKLERMIQSCGFKILSKQKFNFGMAVIFLIENEEI